MMLASGMPTLRSTPGVVVGAAAAATLAVSLWVVAVVVARH